MQPTPTAVKFFDDSFTVELSDGRALSVPYTVSPKLLSATLEQREAVRLSRSGLHWDQLDEDFGINGLPRDHSERLILARLKSVPRAVKVDPDDL
jgi:hypothetical protein